MNTKKTKNFKFCKRCLYSENHPLGIIINSEGICSGCVVHEEKDSLDWEDRLKKLTNDEHFSKRNIMPGKIYLNNDKKGNLITYKNSKYILVLN